MGCGSSTAAGANEQQQPAALPPAAVQGTLAGFLAVQVVSAHDLTAKADRLGSADPFVILSHGAKSWRTRQINNTRDPVWDQTLGILIDNKNGDFSLVVNIYDKDIGTSNDPMGFASIPIGSYLDGGIHDVTVNLTATENTNDIVGRLKLVFSFKNEDEVMLTFWKRIGAIYQTDDNPNGLSRLEFGALLEGLDGVCDEGKLTALFEKADENHDGVVSYEELAKFAKDSDLAVRLESNPNFIAFKTKGLQNRDLLAMYGARFAREGATNDFVTGGFVTSTEASKGWVSRVSEFLKLSHKGEFGAVKNGHILVQRRDTGQIIEERIPPYVRVAIRLLYQSISRPKKAAATNALLKKMTLKQGKAYNDPRSASSIPGFIAQYDLNMNEVEKPLDQFKTYNEFFYRKLKPEARPVSQEPGVIVSPADCRLHCFNSSSEAKEIWIKGLLFTVGKLVGPDLADDFGEDCSVVIARLAPQDYHRYHFPIEGTLGEPHPIAGEYYTVNPMAVYSELDVFGDNVRVVSVLHTPDFGRVAYVCIGATMVGSVGLTSTPGSQVKRGDEHGYFAFGGSTIVLLFQPGTAKFDVDLVANSEAKTETLVKMGERIGIAANK